MIKQTIKNAILHSVVFCTTVLIFGIGYAAITNVWTNTSTLEVSSGSTLSADSWNKLLGNFEVLSGSLNTTNNSVNSLSNTINTLNIDKTPIFSTTNRSSFFVSSTSGWSRNGTSITINVPAGPNRKYRISYKAMGYGDAGNYLITTLSKSSTTVLGTPVGIGSPHEYALDTGRHTTNSEGYVELTPGTHIYYMMVFGGTSYTINYHYDGGYTNIIARPL